MHQNAMIKHCYCGLWHSVVVFEGSEDVYAWGWNKFNQIGKGLGEPEEGKEIISIPRRISEFDCPRVLGDTNITDSIIKITGGTRHTAFLMNSGRLFLMGHLGTSFIEGVDCRGTMSNISECNHIHVTTGRQDLKACLLLTDEKHPCSLIGKRVRCGESTVGCGCDSMKEVAVVDLTQRWKVNKILSLRWSLMARASAS
mmetsp:Transcript_15553/g.21304  ORF Transcript_15553/g.21304 Transcript_15553/m.21304 type:complete len:199 (-) Transcript_15553:28-624(-)